MRAAPEPVGTSETGVTIPFSHGSDQSGSSCQPSREAASPSSCMHCIDIKEELGRRLLCSADSRCLTDQSRERRGSLRQSQTCRLARVQLSTPPQSHYLLRSGSPLHIIGTMLNPRRRCFFSFAEGGEPAPDIPQCVARTPLSRGGGLRYRSGNPPLAALMLRGGECAAHTPLPLPPPSHYLWLSVCVCVFSQVHYRSEWGGLYCKKGGASVL